MILTLEIDVVEKNIKKKSAKYLYLDILTPSREQLMKNCKNSMYIKSTIPFTCLLRMANGFDVITGFHMRIIPSSLPVINNDLVKTKQLLP